MESLKAAAHRFEWALVIYFLCVQVGGGAPSHSQRPVFLQEPPPTLQFSNVTGAVLSCSAHGVPTPDVRWLDAEGKELSHLPRLREVLANGSLYFPPFPPEEYNPEVHAAAYRCRVANAVGTLLSRDCKIRAHVFRPYQVQVHNVFVIRGNVAVLKCGVPSFARGLVAVSAWLKEDHALGRTTLHSGGRFTMTSQGSLHVRDTVSSDAYARFYCWTQDKLTGEKRLSLPGQIIVTEPEGNLPPKIEYSISNVNVKSGQPAELVCVAQGSPPPTYRWYRKVATILQEVQASSALAQPLESVLQFPRAQPEDAAHYVCTVSSMLGEDRREMSLAVNLPLAVHMRPQQQVVDTGTSATFNCSVTGSDAHISWLKDGRTVVDNARTSILLGGQVLMLRAVKKEDRGIYQCMVRSGEESAQSSGELVIGAVAPEMLSTFIEQTLQPGPPVSLRCVSSGNPPPRFTWQLDGGDILPRGYILGSFLDSEGNVVSHLNISSARVLHGGLYTCIARNLLGTAQHSSALNIYGPPSTRSPQNLTAVSSMDVYLRCPVAGFPISSVTWQRTGTILPSHMRQKVLSNGTLLIKQVDGSSDKGEYLCSVTNQQGQSAQGRIYLDVMKPPKITPFQFSNELQKGMRTQASCSIMSGDFPISISWRKDGAPLPQDPDVQDQQHEFVSNLMFRNLAARHSGHYTCIASNAAASSNYTAKLVVKVPPVWVVEPRDVSVLYQNPAILHCQASGFPSPTITWMKAKGDEDSEYVPLGSEHDFVIYGNGSISVQAIDSSHEGHYMCRANNGIGTALTKAIFLRVNVPAHFRTHAVNQSGVAGQGAVLVCEAEGDQPLRVSWSAARGALSPAPAGGGGGGRVSERPTPRGLAAELHLLHLDRASAGPYRCSAANDYGQDEMVVHLAVKEPPEQPSQAEVLEVGSRWLDVGWTEPYSGRAPILRYVVQHRAERDPDWLNATVAAGGQLRARLDGLHPATQYTIQLLAVNEVGASAPSRPVMAVTLQEAPSGPPTEVTVQATSSQSVLVQWKPPLASYAHGDMLGYQVTYREKSGGSQQLRTVRGHSRLEVTLSALRQFTAYEITVCAFNLVGSGPSSPPLIVTTLEGVPDMAPQELKCAALSSQSLRVRWEPPAAEHHNGVIQGYKVFYKHTSPRPGDSPSVEVKKTTNLETNLHGLLKFANYSVQVVAFTSAGEGVRSEQVHCTTEQDVPGPPDLVKALAMTSDSILVAWTRPVEPNGNIVKYYVYTRYMQVRNKEVQKDTVMRDAELVYEARQLKEFQRYEFWVTAATIIGEGPSSPRVSQSPISRAPARIASFSRHVVAKAGASLTLPCRAVGLPAPSRTWRGPGSRPVAPGHRLLPDHGLALGFLRPDDAGNYSCLAENVFGRDEVTYTLAVQVAPGPPVLSVAGATSHGLTVVWRVPDNGGSPITGYTLTYKQDLGEWQNVTVDPDRKSFPLDGLNCGTSYHLFLTAVNAVGPGKPSAVVTSSTKGGAPKVPAQEDFVMINSTSATLYLDAWPDGGCAIQYFTVEYRLRGMSEWVPVSDSVQLPELLVPDLMPATWYSVRVTAHNEAGSSQQEFAFATRTYTGDILLSDLVPEPNENESDIYTHLGMIIPVTSGIVCTIAVMICVCIVVQRRHYAGFKGRSPGYGSKSLADLENKMNSNQQETEHGQSGQLYSPSPARKGDSSLSAQKGSDTSGQEYEIYPYATFSLPGMEKAASAKTMDYSIQFQTFSQHECYAEQPPPRHGGGGGKCHSHARAARCVDGDGGEGKAPPQNHHRRHHHRLHSAGSPPDGLSLEISCISSQQTLPMSSAKAVRGNGDTPTVYQNCPRRRSNSDSDSSGTDGKVARYRQRTRQAPHNDSTFDLDSSVASTEPSPEMPHCPWRGSTRRRVPSK